MMDHERQQNRARSTHGYGLYVYANSFFRYDGEWEDGKKHGHGKLLFRDGSSYEGEFVHGEITGNGLRYWATSGNTYSGEFLEGELHGHGVMRYKDGGRYEGEFLFGIREGHGLLVDKEGQTYSGAFHNNKKYGEGQMTYQNGDHYEGNWVLDLRQGHGVLHFVDGTIYEGQWRNDVFSGQGTMIHSSGFVYDGPWINGHPADIAKKMVILGGDVIDVVQGSPVTIHVQLQKEDGEIAASENGRVLRISAGIKYTPSSKPQSTRILELIEDFEEKPIQTPFGYECMKYPLSYINQEKELLETSSPLPSQSVLQVSSTQLLPADSESHHGIDGNLSNTQDEYPIISISGADIPLPPPNKRVEMGGAVFEDVLFGPPPAKFLSFLEETEKNKKKTSGKLSAEKNEKMTVSQEKIEDSRSELINKDRKGKRENPLADNINAARPGEYVIMVEDVTSSPFMGQTLQTAFKLFRILTEKNKGKNNRRSGMLSVPV
ncbi:MORN repeat-containing protein 1 isoform X2 [Mixophyes fleayi]|uniref:MORN repeat-containing protein 1 isoform X2 n=1 Tax=Mixophyes fleayi TaxID=3061075 RepID=UPI003F4D87BF